MVSAYKLYFYFATIFNVKSFITQSQCPPITSQCNYNCLYVIELCTHHISTGHIINIYIISMYSEFFWSCFVLQKTGWIVYTSEVYTNALCLSVIHHISLQLSCCQFQGAVLHP